MDRKNKSILIIVLLALFSLFVSGAADKPLTAQVMQNKNRTAKQADFQAAMRKLWEDHTTWTRLFIVSAAADLPDKNATTERLLRNQADIGNAVKPYYGDAAGEKLTTLLKEHITTAAELVTAAKANDTVKLEDAKKRWYANADEIAAFLSGANPKNWSPAGMKQMMREHLDLTTNEVVSHLKKDWTADIAAYDKVREQILHMADMLSEGIIKQFPEKFK
jgi:hypothetical protein